MQDFLCHPPYDIVNRLPSALQSFAQRLKVALRLYQWVARYLRAVMEHVYHRRGERIVLFTECQHFLLSLVLKCPIPLLCTCVPLKAESTGLKPNHFSACSFEKGRRRTNVRRFIVNIDLLLQFICFWNSCLLSKLESVARAKSLVERSALIQLLEDLVHCVLQPKSRPCSVLAVTKEMGNRDWSEERACQNSATRTTPLELPRNQLARLQRLQVCCRIRPLRLSL